jgi:hypothetical protein
MKALRSVNSSRLTIDLLPVAIVAMTGALTIVFWTPDGHDRGGHPYFLAAVLAENLLALLKRRRHPTGAFMGVLAAYVLFDALAISLLPMALAISTVAASRSRRVVGLTTAVTALAIAAVPLIHSDSFDVVHVLLPMAALVGAVVAGRCAAGLRLRPIPTPCALRINVPLPISSPRSTSSRPTV